MLFVVNKILLLFLLLFVLISIIVLNSIILDFNYKNKTTLKSVCQQFNGSYDEINFKIIKNVIKNNNKYITNDSETSFVNISDNIYIYSGFEINNRDTIVLIGFAKNWEQISDDYNYYNYNNSYKVEDYQYYCGFNEEIAIKTLASIEYLPESHDYYYSAIKVFCKRPKLFDQNLTINRVKLIQKRKQLNKNYANNESIESKFVFIARNANQLKTNNNNNSYYDLDLNESSGGIDRPFTASPQQQPQQQLVVCVRPLYGNISAINLLEFIAYYRLNGINRFVLYNSIPDSHMSNRTKQLFDLLSSLEFVDVLPFYLPNNQESRPTIHAKGQLIAIHDCLYRFVDGIQIHVDFDEFIITYNYRTIKDFLLSKEVSHSSALVVPTVLFCNEFNYNTSKRYGSLLISNFNRQKTVWPHEIRSKVIIMRPALISQMGIHNVWKLSPFYRQQKSHPILYSKSNQILIYHYRKCCDIIQPYFTNFIHFRTINDYIIRDDSMKPYIKRVKQFIDRYVEIIY